eukprot:6476670-Amphidinium_carterae.1
MELIRSNIGTANETIPQSLRPQAVATGGLLESLPAAGWEARAEAPTWNVNASKLVVYAKRIPARQLLALPSIQTSACGCIPFELVDRVIGGCFLTDVRYVHAGPVLAVVLKVDTEAFDAVVETSNGCQLTAVPMQETVVAWFDTQHRYAWVPAFLNSGSLFRPVHEGTPEGTVFKLRASSAFRAYMVVEASYNNSGGRSGGFTNTLPAAGWFTEAAAPSWDDKKSVMKVFSKMVPESRELTLPPTEGTVVFSLVVVSISSSQERLAEELKRAFRAWD